MIHGVMCYAYTTLLKTNVDTASLSASRLAVERDRITQTGLDGPNESVGMLRRHITDDTFTNAVHALPSPADWSVWSAEAVSGSTVREPLAIRSDTDEGDGGESGCCPTLATVTAPPAQLIYASVSGAGPTLFDVLSISSIVEPVVVVSAHYARMLKKRYSPGLC